MSGIRIERGDELVFRVEDPQWWEHNGKCNWQQGLDEEVLVAVEATEDVQVTDSKGRISTRIQKVRKREIGEDERFLPVPEGRFVVEVGIDGERTLLAKGNHYRPRFGQKEDGVFLEIF